MAARRAGCAASRRAPACTAGPFIKQGTEPARPRPCVRRYAIARSYPGCSRWSRRYALQHATDRLDMHLVAAAAPRRLACTAVTAVRSRPTKSTPATSSTWSKALAAAGAAGAATAGSSAERTPARCDEQVSLAPVIGAIGVASVAGAVAGYMLSEHARSESTFGISYTPSGANTAAVAGKPVLVVIDVQVKFTDDKENVTSSTKIPRIINVCRRWMAAGHPIVFARFCYKKGMVTDPEFKCSRVILPSDEDNVSLDYGLLRAIYDSPYPERIFRIEKNRASTVDANFEKMCARFDWTEFGVCGFTSNVCIAATCKDICEKNIGNVAVLEDICAEQKAARVERGDHVAGMKKVAMLQRGRVLTSEAFLAKHLGCTP